MITMRVHARDLVLDLDRARDHAIERARDLGVLDSDNIVGRGLRLILDLDCTSGRDRAFDLARELARTRELGRTRGLGRARDRSRPLARAHARASGRALGRARELGRELALALDHAPDLELGRLISTLGRAPDLARELARDLDAQQVDASGADLSDLEIRHLDVLDRIIWTRQTTWPSRVADQVEARSVEIRPGVYQIHFGNTSDRHVLTSV